MSLTLNINDFEIANIRDLLASLNDNMNELGRSRKLAKTTSEKNTITNQIADLQLKYNRENSALAELQKSNRKRTYE